MSLHGPLIDPAALREGLPEVLVVDCSHDLAAPASGAREFESAHIPGAVHMHLDQDLSAPLTAGSGRHPLPQPQALAERLAALGLRQGLPVVAYDRSFGVYAARLWWLLRWLDLGPAAVLDGGWQAWLASGGAPEIGPARPRAPGRLQAAARPAMPTIEVDALLADVLLQPRQHLVVDARSPQRYAGEGETLDPVGGHIPGAVCRFYRDNLDADGRFLPAPQLRRQWLQVLGGRHPREVVNQCGSGVSACHNLLALEIAGLAGSSLYPGLWSQWCADPARPVARGAEP